MLLTGSEIVIEILAEEGVDTVFGYPGGNVLSLYDKLAENKKGIKHILTAHEQGASHAADGYSRAGNKVGVLIATSGPGATNTITGLATAFADSVPVIAITGSVPIKSVGTDSFQEIDTASLTLAATKHSFFIKDVNKIADTLRQAFYIAKSGRPGPVLVDIPSDIQKEMCDFEPIKAVNTDFDEPEADEKSLDEAVEMINNSEKPIIYSGGGVINCGAANIIKTICEKSGAYAAFTMMGISAMSNTHPKYLGMAGLYGRMEASKAISKADLIVAAGVRFSDRGTGSREKFAQNAKVIHIDIDGAELGKVINANLQIGGNLKKSLEYIALHIKEKKHVKWDKEIEEFKKEFNVTETESFTPKKIIEAVNGLTNEYTPIATDVGQHQMWVSKYYNFKKPKTHLTSGGFGTMGYGMGAAIGAAVAAKMRSVLFTGDGSFCMNFNEVTTAVRNNIPVTVIVLNNGGLGMIRQLQDCFCDGRRFSTELERKTDFALLAKAMGAKGYSVKSIDELIKAYKDSEKYNGPAVIDCFVSEKENAMPMIPPNGTIEDLMR